ncbi:2-oxo acid dehydrogenase subunit E2 [Planctomonas sp. JC2975]|uniref:2-oxo acid dehydrogenase subunit E2 n=1 Tax=Planctomonas sp. JC2975 TaxID=2729626 RepID=UPI0014756A5B|nr:2-oxo acid dehydrogenase subunit E2 [Planctomonas sp. JC2975]
MSVKEFALPDLGEGLTESEVVAWRVSVGETVELNQIIAEVETAKALVEVPSPFAGVVRALHAEPGETLEVGAPLMSFDVDDGSGGSADVVPEGAEADASAGEPARVPEPVGAAVGAASGTRSGRPVVGHDSGRPRVEAATGPGPNAPVEGGADEERHAMLVGRGPKAQSSKRPQRRSRSGRLVEPFVWERPAGVGKSSAAASVRSEAATDRAAGSATESSGSRGETASGEVRTAATGVRRRTAEAMARSAAVPQVTEFLTVDVTRGIRLLDRLADTAEFRGRRLTVLTLAARALCLALESTPEANTRWDETTGEIVAPPTVNLGIAVAMQRGLVVPNIRDAASMRMPDLADALVALVDRARSGKSTPSEFSGGTITITNVGVFGVDAGTPLLNPGETAILALGAVARRPWEHKGKVRLRQVMTLSLTFDHRVIDGEQGSRLLRDVARILSDPATALAVA